MPGYGEPWRLGHEGFRGSKQDQTVGHVQLPICVVMTESQGHNKLLPSFRSVLGRMGGTSAVPTCLQTTSQVILDASRQGLCLFSRGYYIFLLKTSIFIKEHTQQCPLPGTTDPPGATGKEARGLSG